MGAVPAMIKRAKRANKMNHQATKRPTKQIVRAMMTMSRRRRNSQKRVLWPKVHPRVLEAYSVKACLKNLTMLQESKKGPQKALLWKKLG